MINQTLFLFLNNLAGQSVWTDKLIIFCADYLSYVMIFLVIAFYLPNKNRRNFLMLFEALISALIARGIAVTLIRFLYHHLRPFDVMRVHQLIPESGYSFPSGHASFFFAIATGLYLYNKKLGSVVFVLSIIMGIGRITAGVHWPADIFGGLIVGMLTALVVHLYFKKYSIKPRVYQAQ